MTSSIPLPKVLGSCADLLAQYCQTYGGEPQDHAALAQALQALQDANADIPPALALWHVQQGHAELMADGPRAAIDANLALRFPLLQSTTLSFAEALPVLTSLFDAKAPGFSLGTDEETFLSCEIVRLERDANANILATLHLHARWIDSLPEDCPAPLEHLNARLQYRALAMAQPAWSITHLNEVTPL